MQENNPHTLTELIKQKASLLGFDGCSIIAPQPALSEQNNLQHWLENQFHAEMHYLERNSDKRIDPLQIMPDACSMIMLIKNYFPKEQQEKDTLQIAKYAYGTDYHRVIKQLLHALEQYIQSLVANAKTISYTDTGAILEKHHASRAGLGSIGKHSLLITPAFGSYCFIAEILTDVVLEYDQVQPKKDICGNCSLCIDACPTQAITAPYVIDARRCISYNTIESKTSIAEDVQHNMQGYIYGCDICQDVCPHNKQAKPNTTVTFQLTDALKQMTYNDWLALDSDRFSVLFSDTPVKRMGFERMKTIIEYNK